MSLFHPVNDHYGLSPIEAAATAIDIHNAAARWNKALLDNSARPSGALVYTARERAADGRAVRAAEARAGDGFQGARNAGRPLLLEGGLDWKPCRCRRRTWTSSRRRTPPRARSRSRSACRRCCSAFPATTRYSNDPHDPGGPTNRGITLKVFADWKGVRLDRASCAALTGGAAAHPRAAVRDIYFARYWTPAHCAELAPALAFFHFDAAVNHGVTGATRLLQRAVGTDARRRDRPQYARCHCALSVDESCSATPMCAAPAIARCTTSGASARGWLARVDKTLARAPGSRSSDADTTPIPADEPKGQTTWQTPRPDTQPTAKWWGQSITIWGAIITGLSTVLPALGPAFGVDITGDLVREAGEGIVQTVQAVGGLLGTIMTIYGRVRATQAAGATQPATEAVTRARDARIHDEFRRRNLREKDVARLPGPAPNHRSRSLHLPSRCLPSARRIPASPIGRSPRPSCTRRG